MPKNTANNSFLMSFVPQTQINVIKKEHQVVGAGTLTWPNGRTTESNGQTTE